jgi:hypothetical protein
MRLTVSEVPGRSTLLIALFRITLVDTYCIDLFVRVWRVSPGPAHRRLLGAPRSSPNPMHSPVFTDLEHFWALFFCSQLLFALHCLLQRLGPAPSLWFRRILDSREQNRLCLRRPRLG